MLPKADHRLLFVGLEYYYIVIHLASIQCFLLVANRTRRFYDKAMYYALVHIVLAQKLVCKKKCLSYYTIMLHIVDTPNTQRYDSQCEQQLTEPKNRV